VKLNASLQQGRGHDCDQQAVWRDVDRYLAQTGTTSPTAAFADGFCERRGGVAGALATFKPEAGQVGTAAVQRGRLLGLDVFGSRSLYARGWAKVARGILADVYDEAPAPDEHAAIRTVQSALSAMAEMLPQQTAAPGLGCTVHATSRGITLAGIAVDDTLYHAMAAPSMSETGED
jgi:ARG/rhodanese/phosphatase superfamily protein